MDYTPMVSSPTMNASVYNQISASPVTLSLGLQNCRCSTKTIVKVYITEGGSQIKSFLVYTPLGGLPIFFQKVYKTNKWFDSNFLSRFKHLFVVWKFKIPRFTQLLANQKQRNGLHTNG